MRNAKLVTLAKSRGRFRPIQICNGRRKVAGKAILSGIQNTEVYYD